MSTIDIAWTYLRRVIEASREDVLDALWPEGWDTRRVTGEPGRAVELAEALRRRDPDLGEALLSATQSRCANSELPTPEADAERAAALGWRMITPADHEWPDAFTDAFVRMINSGADYDASVRGQAAAPFAVWVKGSGRLDVLARRAVTVVGTRTPSRYGVEVTRDVTRDVAAQGCTIVSGGAFGVDTVAHRAAMDAGGQTIAVMACGPGVNYPARNMALFDEICTGGGLLISEYPPDTRPARHRFLTRNRLVAALGRATLLTEAPARSGALNTLNWAESMLNYTMAIPGAVTNPVAQGGLLRIQQGRARLIRNAEDVLAPFWDAEQLAFELSEGSLADLKGAEQGRPRSWEETAVYDATGVHDDDTGRVADIAEATGMSITNVVRVLRTLEREELIVREGDRWVKLDRLPG